MSSKGKGYRELELEGWQILVGKGASDNDRLSLEIAEPDDWWFHVADYSGSHVIVRCAPYAEPPREVVRYAAAQAAWHSKARGAKGKVDVHQCLAKDVSKPRGFAAGKVLLRCWNSIKVYVKDPDG